MSVETSLPTVDVRIKISSVVVVDSVVEADETLIAIKETNKIFFMHRFESFKRKFDRI